MTTLPLKPQTGVSTGAFVAAPERRPSRGTGQVCASIPTPEALPPHRLARMILGAEYAAAAVALPFGGVLLLSAMLRPRPFGRSVSLISALVLPNLSSSRAKSSSSSKRWLNRQSRDPFVRARTSAGFRSRAAFKLLEMDKVRTVLGYNHYRIP